MVYTKFLTDSDYYLQLPAPERRLQEVGTPMSYAVIHDYIPDSIASIPVPKHLFNTDSRALQRLGFDGHRKSLSDISVLSANPLSRTQGRYLLVQGKGSQN
jgi:hypothetical protein